MQISTTIIKSNMKIPQKARELPYNSVIPLLGIYPKERMLDTIGTPVHRCSSQHYSHFQALETSQVPRDNEWIKKMWYTYTMEFYSAMRINDMWFEVK
jgi:hypothetical protein